MVPGRADETQLSGLVVDDSLELELECVVSMGLLDIVSQDSTYFTLLGNAIIQVLFVVLQALPE